MNVKIIAGSYGGQSLKAPNNFKTHPMSERVRGSLFNIVQNELAGAKVLDIFAGSGSLGIEAISRGASEVVFVERDLAANKILNENVKKLDLNKYSKIHKMGAKTFIDKNQGESFDVIFADPPYNDMQLSTVSELGGILKPNGLMVLSYPGRGEVPTVYGVVVVDNRNYGTAALAFYRKK